MNLRLSLCNSTVSGQTLTCWRAALLIVGLVVGAADLGAQENSTLEIGDLIRVTAPERGLVRQTALFLRLYRDTLTVQADSQLVLPVANVTRLEVSRGMINRPTYFGMAAGAVAGVLIAISVAPDKDSDFAGGTSDEIIAPQIANSGGEHSSSTVSGAVVAPVAGALIGAFVGGLVGKQFRKHNWEVFPLAVLRGRAAPRGGGTCTVGIAVRKTF